MLCCAPCPSSPLADPADRRQRNHRKRSWLEGALRRHAPGISTRAVVRSQHVPSRANRGSRQGGRNPEETRIVDYTRPKGSSPPPAKGCDAAIHLVGILRETPPSTYARRPMRRPARPWHEGAAKGRLTARSFTRVFSALRPCSLRNACLGSKGRAERILLEGPVSRHHLAPADGDGSAQTPQPESPGETRPNRPFCGCLVGGGARPCNSPSTFATSSRPSARPLRLQTSSRAEHGARTRRPRSIVSHRELVGSCRARSSARTTAHRRDSDGTPASRAG